jgi:hypothetical protein
MTKPYPDDPRSVRARPGDPGATGDGVVEETPDQEPEERVVVSRAIAWLLVALVVIAGLILYFVFARRSTPLVG